MIAAFLDSWELFGNAYLVGWMIAFALSGIGVWVVARNQIFLGAAVAQASGFGVALALRIGSSAAAVSLPWLASDALHAALAVGASVATALVTSREAHGRESSEAVTGWVFLLASSGAVLLVAHSPHGLEEVKQILLSTLLGVSGTDVWLFAGLALLTGAGIAGLQRSILLFAVDPEMAGAAVSLPWLASDALHAALAVGASVATALVTSREAHGRESSEAVTGWVFLLASSGAVLLVAHSPHGLEEVKQILLSTLLGVSGTDVWLFAGLALLTGAGIAGLQRSILLFAVDPEMAGAVGMRTGLWKALTAVWLGVAVGLAIHAAGMLYAFGCLVLPPLIAKNLCREMRSVFVLAPLLGVSAAVVGFVLANHYDTPPAHTTVALFCALLAGAWIRRSRRDR